MCKRITQMPTNSLRTTRETKCVCMWVKASDNQKREREKSHGKRRITSSKKERERENQSKSIVQQLNCAQHWQYKYCDIPGDTQFLTQSRQEQLTHTQTHWSQTREIGYIRIDKKIDFCSMLVSLKVYEKSINQSHRNLSNAFESYKNRLFMNFQPLYLMDLSFLSTSSIFALCFSLSLSLDLCSVRPRCLCMFVSIVRLVLLGIVCHLMRLYCDTCLHLMNLMPMYVLLRVVRSMNWHTTEKLHTHTPSIQCIRKFAALFLFAATSFQRWFLSFGLFSVMLSLLLRRFIEYSQKWVWHKRNCEQNGKQKRIVIDNL